MLNRAGGAGQGEAVGGGGAGGREAGLMHARLMHVRPVEDKAEHPGWMALQARHWNTPMQRVWEARQIELPTFLLASQPQRPMHRRLPSSRFSRPLDNIYGTRPRPVGRLGAGVDVGEPGGRLALHPRRLNQVTRRARREQRPALVACAQARVGGCGREQSQQAGAGPSVAGGAAAAAARPARSLAAQGTKSCAV